MTRTERKMHRTNWGAVLVDLAVIILAILVSIWQNNPNYLWLLALLALTGSYEFEVSSDEKEG